MASRARWSRVRLSSGLAFHFLSRQTLHAVHEPSLAARPRASRRAPGLSPRRPRPGRQDFGRGCWRQPRCQTREERCSQKSSGSDSTLFPRCGQGALGRFNLRINARQRGKRAEVVNRRAVSHLLRNRGRLLPQRLVMRFGALNQSLNPPAERREPRGQSRGGSDDDEHRPPTLNGC